MGRITIAEMEDLKKKGLLDDKAVEEPVTFEANVESEKSTLKVLLAAIVPPPLKPVPAVNVTPLWSMCSLATNPLKLSWTISPSVVVISLALAVMPVPPMTFKTEFVAVIPAPANKVATSAKFFWAFFRFYN